MAKATPTMVRLTVSVLVNRDAYVKEYDGETPKKADLTESLRSTIEGALNDSELGQHADIYTVDVL